MRLGELGMHKELEKLEAFEASLAGKVKRNVVHQNSGKQPTYVTSAFVLDE